MHCTFNIHLTYFTPSQYWLTDHILHDIHIRKYKKYRKYRFTEIIYNKQGSVVENTYKAKITK